MCPICWATALASFGALLAVSVVTLAATDPWTLTGAMILGIASIIHRGGIVLLPWWVFVILAIGVVNRLSYLLLFERDRLLVVKAWSHALQIAARRCRAKDGQHIFSDAEAGSPVDGAAIDSVQTKGRY